MNALSSTFFKDFFQYVRSNSPYYGDLWEHVPDGVSDIEDLPVTELREYWNASKNDRLLTSKSFNDGIVVRSGGTTSEPKIVYASRDELQQGIVNLAASLSTSSGIRPGDRIANLTHTGGMHASFLGVTLALHQMQTQHVHLPITGNEPVPNIADFIKRFDATVILSNVFTVCRIADYLAERGETVDSIRLILFFGEGFYKDLRASWSKAFPNIRAGPSMYAASDGGLLASLAELPGESEDNDIKPTYRVNRPMIVLEILAEDGSVIKEPGKRGRVIVTDMRRKLHPMIRYPIGDVAMWVDYKRGTFELLGRESVALKMGSLHLELPTLRLLVVKTLGESFQNSFQLVVRRLEGKNEVTIRFAGQHHDPESVRRELEQNLIEAFPRWQELLNIGYVQPLKTEWVKMGDLVMTSNSGKLQNVIDERYPEDHASAI
jgi:phenylacetate-CoA ligase